MYSLKGFSCNYICSRYSKISVWEIWLPPKILKTEREPFEDRRSVIEEEMKTYNLMITQFFNTVLNKIFSLPLSDGKGQFYYINYHNYYRTITFFVFVSWCYFFQPPVLLLWSMDWNSNYKKIKQRLRQELKTFRWNLRTLLMMLLLVSVRNIVNYIFFSY